MTYTITHPKLHTQLHTNTITHKIIHTIRNTITQKQNYAHKITYTTYKIKRLLKITQDYSKNYIQNKTHEKHSLLDAMKCAMVDALKL